MIPICRDTGSVIAFGGRAMDADQAPKYLNSPETAIYSKGRTLYGLNLSKGGDPEAGLRRHGRGLFRLRAGVSVGGGAGRRLVRHGADPAAGAAAAAVHARRSSSASTRTPPARAPRPGRANCWWPKGSTSTSWCWTRAKIPTRSSGGRAQSVIGKGSGPRSRISSTCSIRRRPGSTSARTRAGGSSWAKMLAVAARIPEATARDQFADRIAHKARVTEEVVRAEIRKAAVQQEDGADDPGAADVWAS